MPNTNPSDPNSYTAGGNAVAKPIVAPLSMTGTPNQTATTADPLGLKATADAAQKIKDDQAAKEEADRAAQAKLIPGL